MNEEKIVYDLDIVTSTADIALEQIKQSGREIDTIFRRALKEGVGDSSRTAFATARNEVKKLSNELKIARYEVENISSGEGVDSVSTAAKKATSNMERLIGKTRELQRSIVELETKSKALSTKDRSILSNLQGFGRAPGFSRGFGEYSKLGSELQTGHRYSMISNELSAKGMAEMKDFDERFAIALSGVEGGRARAEGRAWGPGVTSKMGGGLKGFSELDSFVAKSSMYIYAAERVGNAMYAMGKQLFEAGSSGAKFKDMEVAFNNMSKVNPANIEKMGLAVSRTVSDENLMRMANLGRTLGLSGKDLELYARVAKVAGQNLGKSTEEMYESIVTGAARKSKLLLDNLGISMDRLNYIYAQGAKKLGKSREELSQEEETLMFQEALKKSAQSVLQGASGGDASVDPYLQQQAAIENLRNEFNVFIDDAVKKSGLLALTGRSINSLGTAFENSKPLIESLVESFVEVAEVAGSISESLLPGLLMNLDGVSGVVAGLAPILNLSSKAMALFQLPTNLATQAIGNLTDSLSDLVGDLLDSAGPGFRDFGEWIGVVSSSTEDLSSKIDKLAASLGNLQGNMDALQEFFKGDVINQFAGRTVGDMSFQLNRNQKEIEKLKLEGFEALKNGGSAVSAYVIAERNKGKIEALEKENGLLQKQIDLTSALVNVDQKRIDSASDSGKKKIEGTWYQELSLSSEGDVKNAIDQMVEAYGSVSAVTDKLGKDQINIRNSFKNEMNERGKQFVEYEKQLEQYNKKVEDTIKLEEERSSLFGYQVDSIVPNIEKPKEPEGYAVFSEMKGNYEKSMKNIDALNAAMYGMEIEGKLDKRHGRKSSKKDNWGDLFEHMEAVMKAMKAGQDAVDRYGDSLSEAIEPVNQKFDRLKDNIIRTEDALENLYKSRQGTDPSIFTFKMGGVDKILAALEETKKIERAEAVDEYMKQFTDAMPNAMEDFYTGWNDREKELNELIKIHGSARVDLLNEEEKKKFDAIGESLKRRIVLEKDAYEHLHDIEIASQYGQIASPVDDPFAYARAMNFQKENISKRPAFPGQLNGGAIIRQGQRAPIETETMFGMWSEDEKGKKKWDQNEWGDFMEDLGARGGEAITLGLSAGMSEFRDIMDMSFIDVTNSMATMLGEVIDDYGAALSQTIGAAVGEGLGGGVLGTLTGGIFGALGSFVTKLLWRDEKKDKKTDDNIKRIAEKKRDIQVSMTIVNQGLSVNDSVARQVHSAFARALELGAEKLGG